MTGPFKIMMFSGLLFSLLLPGSEALSAVKELNHCRGNHDDLASYGSRGYAVRYKVPNPAKDWFANRIIIVGEPYGDPEAEFTIAFMDMEGNVYGESKHVKGSYLTEYTPTEVTIKIPPVELPEEFKVCVDFKSTKDDGVYIGYINNGGGHSELIDSDYNLYDLEEGIDFCLGLRVSDSVKGNFIPYDPSSFTKKAGVKKETGEVKVKTETSDLVAVEYVGLDEIWPKAMVRLLECALKVYGEVYGLKHAGIVQVSVRVDPESEGSGVALREDGVLEWVIKANTELLPKSRGGPHANVFSFCRDLGRLLVRENLIRSHFAPAGQEEGFAAYLAGFVVADVYGKCERALWPVPFNYQLEEGPKYVDSWIGTEESPPPDKRYAGLLREVQSRVGPEKFNAHMKRLFEKKPPARDVVRTLREMLEEAGEGEWLDEFFLEEMVRPPIVWCVDKPNLEDLAAFEGLNAKRYKSHAFLSYETASGKKSGLLAEEEHLIFFTTPPGSWLVDNLKVFCRRTGPGREDRVTVKLLDENFKVLGELEVPHARIAPKKLKWCDLGGIAGIKVSVPFYLSFFTASGEDGGIEIGINEEGDRSHSLIMMPGSHVRGLEGGGDWMVRLYLAPEEAMDKAALDEAVLKLRRSLATLKKRR